MAVEFSNFSSIFEIAAGLNIGLSKSNSLRRFFGFESAIQVSIDAATDQLRKVEEFESRVNKKFDAFNEKDIQFILDLKGAANALKDKIKRPQVKYWNGVNVNNWLFLLHMLFGIFSFSLLLLCGIIDEDNHDSSLLLLNVLVCAATFIITIIILRKARINSRFRQLGHISGVLWMLVSYFTCFGVALITPTHCIESSFGYFSLDEKIFKELLYITTAFLVFMPLLIFYIYFNVVLRPLLRIIDQYKRDNDFKIRYIQERIGSIFQENLADADSTDSPTSPNEWPFA